jgi:uncharacterized repeat protein (TIGR03803 family)
MFSSLRHPVLVVSRINTLTGQTRRRAAAFSLALVFGLALAVSPLAQAQAFTVLYSFAGYPTDGAGPGAGLLMDAAGTLYGTTAFGGNVNGAHCASSGYLGCGTVFKLDTNGVETVLHNFTGRDGADSSATLIRDAKGVLYGTTTYGGNLQDCGGTGAAGCGVVFELSGDKETVLHRFTGGDGAFPQAGLVMDGHGNLYGTAVYGGKFNDGVVFKLAGKKETVLHSFTGGKDGAEPASGLLLDATGNLYGTDAYGGDIDCDYPSGCGVVFKLAGKHLRVLYSFKGPPNGEEPIAAVIMDAEGNLYGTTDRGGPYNAGTVFELSPSGRERVLHRFRVNYKVQHDGEVPDTAVVRDAQGNLYGTTEDGGPSGYGVVYEITADGKEKILHDFCTGDCSDGAFPNGLIMDAEGNFYGTAFGGGTNGDGTIFMITP